MAEEDPANEYRLQGGNDAFAKKKFEEAEDLYSKALDAAATNHLVWGNRSAARLNLGKNEEALADAMEALRLDPKYLKGYHRRACAHRAMGDSGAVVQAYQDALQVDITNEWVQKQLKISKKEHAEFLRQKPVESVEDWLALFNILEDARERMLQLAEFWNNSSPEIEQMVELPMDNYEDMERNESWINFYKTKDSESKLSIFEKTWEITTDQEKTIIINDLKHFFLLPILKEKGKIQCDDEEEEGDDDNF
eukprot:CAMPEP_0117834466 /NCGR_PEP_ID=MMETSP0949-20121206/10927_1 /TAXON_ID=44440 /ORGANISM="Chattonella subsalsa, Strain CCMP2191" /LENGTH=250 /DNA_ID=CAMNT_0005676311 /DNA_START=57 /DNA_END=810 /DNA_ORIENTATION=-